MKKKHTNTLIDESSPYLLQHAHNPVAWHPWKKEVLKLAQSENKPLLISIGYAACHWCHVMEKESFEDEEVAIVMNSNFINIKVDREEHPDIDHIYMDAVQLMTGSGGWPLNIVALPDGRPFWGGTYFKKEQWKAILTQLAELYKTDVDKILEYATQLQQGIVNNNHTYATKSSITLNSKTIEESVKKWAAHFDEVYGGTKRTPKFMMPVNLQFLRYYAVQTQEENLINYLETTLTKIAYGGIYDHIGGGFARYSVDEKWHIPHFEKMLYDNAQLVSVYSTMYLVTKNTLYQEVVEKTLRFIAEELTHTEGAFFSSLDADSINEKGIWEEGAFYTWKKHELQQLLQDDFELFADYYNINAFGLWENESYVLIRKTDDIAIAQKYKSSIAHIKTIISKCNRILFKERNKRNKPRLDDKTLTSWNALMLKGYVDAYKAFGNKAFLNSAIKNAEFLVKNQLKEDGGLYHSFKNGKSTINGFLEDYAAVCNAFIGLYEVSCDEKWLLLSKKLVNYCYDYFYDEKSGFFFFTSNKDDVIVTKPVEKADNVIPASNSILAGVLFKLSKYFENDSYLTTARTMLLYLKDDIILYPYSYANWLTLALHLNTDFYEIAVVGDSAQSLCKALTTHYLPNAVIAGSKKASDLPLLKNRYIKDSTFIYVCKNNSCKLPVETVGEAIRQIKTPPF